MMNRIIATLSVLFTLTFAGPALADTCGQALKDAAQKAAQDKQCQKDAKNIFKALGNQFSDCKAFRTQLKSCRKAKRASTQSCTKAKRLAKKGCKNAKKSCLSSCPKGKKGKSCRKSCRTAKRTCMKTVRNTKRACKTLARTTKKACRNEAKATSAFAICKSARKITAQAAGNAVKCAGKYFAKPIGLCITELLSEKNN